MGKKGQSLSLAKSSSHKKQSQSKSLKAGLVFPVSRVNRHLREARLSKRVGSGAPIYLAAVLEYVALEIFELTSRYVLANGFK